MKLTLRRPNENTAELIIETGGAVIRKDLSNYNRDAKKWTVDSSTIEQFITVANELSRFNQQGDIEFVKNIIEAFLTEGEKEELFDHYKESFTNYKS